MYYRYWSLRASLLTDTTSRRRKGSRSLRKRQGSFMTRSSGSLRRGSIAARSILLLVITSRIKFFSPAYGGSEEALRKPKFILHYYIAPLSVCACELHFKLFHKKTTLRLFHRPISGVSPDRYFINAASSSRRVNTPVPLNIQNGGL